MKKGQIIVLVKGPMKAASTILHQLKDVTLFLET